MITSMLDHVITHSRHQLKMQKWVWFKCWSLTLHDDLLTLQWPMTHNMMTSRLVHVITHSRHQQSRDSVQQLWRLILIFVRVLLIYNWRWSRSRCFFTDDFEIHLIITIILIIIIWIGLVNKWLKRVINEWSDSLADLRFLDGCSNSGQ